MQAPAPRHAAARPDHRGTNALLLCDRGDPPGRLRRPGPTMRRREGDPSAGPGGGAVRDWSLAGRAGEALERLADVSDEVFWMMDAHARNRLCVERLSGWEPLNSRAGRRLSRVARTCRAEDAEKPSPRTRSALARRPSLRSQLPDDGWRGASTLGSRAGLGGPRCCRRNPDRSSASFATRLPRKSPLIISDSFLREMNHRVKNTLATVVSIARQTAATAPDLDVFLESFNARVLAFLGRP